MRDLKKPYLVLLGSVDCPEDAKTGSGLAYWRKDWCLGQIKVGDKAADVGLPNLTIAEAVAKGAGSIVIGVAPIGGSVDPQWMPILVEALENGLDLVSGMHMRASEIPELTASAAKSGAKIWDIRHTERKFGSGSPDRRTGKRLLTVGTDCAVGKKYTALALTEALRRSGRSVEFCATGQTGLLIAERGVAIDAVVSDFAVGAAASLSPNAPDEHIFVIEGQGALLHPIYGGVTLSLIYGSQPDYLWLCHKAGNTHLMDYPGVSIPDLREYIEIYIRLASVANPNVELVGMSFNTSHLTPYKREAYLSKMTDELGVLCIDPLVSDLSTVHERLMRY